MTKNAIGPIAIQAERLAEIALQAEQPADIGPLRGPHGIEIALAHAQFLGIAYNSKVTGEVKSFAELLDRPDLKGKVTLLTEMRDTMGFLLKVTGADPNEFSEDEWHNALDKLRSVVSAGQVRAFTGNDYIQDLAAGNIVACEAWSGDVIQAQIDNPAIKFVTPEEGLMLWSDNMLVPNGAEHQANAETWMNYFYQPDVAVIPIGDHFTMGPREAAVALELLGVARCVPCHWGTFGLLTGTPDALRELAPPGVEVLSPEPGEPLAF